MAVSPMAILAVAAAQHHLRRHVDVSPTDCDRNSVNERPKADTKNALSTAMYGGVSERGTSAMQS